MVVMKCPQCRSTKTHRPPVSHPEWRCGQQWCDDCGHRGDWTSFVEGLSPEVRERYEAVGEKIAAEVEAGEAKLVKSLLRKALS